MPLCCCFGRPKKQVVAPPPVETDEDSDGAPDYTPWWVKEEQTKANSDTEHEEGYQSAGELEAAEKRKSLKHAAEIQQPPAPEKRKSFDESFADGLTRMRAELGDCSKYDEDQWERVLARYSPVQEGDVPAPGAGARSLSPKRKRIMLDRALVLCIRARYVLLQLVEDHSSASRNDLLTEEACDMLRNAVEVQSATLSSDEFMSAGISCMDTHEDVSESDLLETLLRSTIWFQLVLQFQPRNHTALEHWMQRVKDLREEFPYVALDPLHTPPTGYCLLHCAAMQNNAAIVLESLSYNCNVNTRTDDSAETPLHLVSTSGEPNLDLVKDLLRSGASMDLQESQGKTALFLACENQSKDLIQLLLDSHASPDVKAHGKTCLDVARDKGNEAIFRMITKSTEPSVPEDAGEKKERKRAAAEKKKRQRAETFQKHNPMETPQVGEAAAEVDEESEADYDESGDDESASGWSDIGESSRAEEMSAAAESEASERAERRESSLAELDEEEAMKIEESERRRNEERKKAEAAAGEAASGAESDVDYKSTDLYKEFAVFKAKASPTPTRSN